MDFYLSAKNELLITDGIYHDNSFSLVDRQHITAIRVQTLSFIINCGCLKYNKLTLFTRK